jgi:hypothetical protein
MLTRSRNEFCTEYCRVLGMALESGARVRPIRTKSPNAPFVDDKHQSEFLKACHRGYEKAQHRIVEMISDLRSDSTLDDAEKEFRELTLRKIIDGIAVLLLQNKSHLIRRFILHNGPPATELGIIKEALREASRLNSESRLTFALIADLTTFIHVCDILRMDFREGRLSLIELKSGRVNQILLSELERYTPDKASLGAVDSDERIDPKHRKQAKRILRQRIRVAQVEHMFSHDEGVDIALQKPLRLSKDEIEVTHYDELLDQLCTDAKENGVAAGVSNHCIHVGVGYAEEPETALHKAKVALNRGISEARKRSPTSLQDIEDALSGMIPKEELFQATNLFESNLVAMSSRPFTAWFIHRDHLRELLAGRMVVLAAFDLAAFIWLGRSIGLAVELTSRRGATQQAQELGSGNVPTWGGRALRYVFGPQRNFTLLSGMFSRFFNDLTNPLPLMVYDRDRGIEMMEQAQMR